MGREIRTSLDEGQGKLTRSPECGCKLPKTVSSLPRKPDKFKKCSNSQLSVDVNFLDHRQSPVEPRL